MVSGGSTQDRWKCSGQKSHCARSAVCTLLEGREGRGERGEGRGEGGERGEGDRGLFRPTAGTRVGVLR